MRTIVVMMMVLLLSVPCLAETGFKEGTKEAGREATKQGRTVGGWFRDAGKKTGDAFRQLGRDIRKFLTGN